jgi:hypothetical protein
LHWAKSTAAESKRENNTKDFFIPGASLKLDRKTNSEFPNKRNNCCIFVKIHCQLRNNALPELNYFCQMLVCLAGFGL